ncbi:hypothetical protein CEXT_304051 [Caerostris extrusa]|uniref:Uncharacterized protein n=1 Tax=Caerostris extrusa TaxID=172846 RepID=A0AAV4MG08_CAEEX|nr:hypothetical protein CEXT_304051 [Caerostris extrusa]
MDYQLFEKTSELGKLPPVRIVIDLRPLYLKLILCTASTIVLSSSLLNKDVECLNAKRSSTQFVSLDTESVRNDPEVPIVEIMAGICIGSSRLLPKNFRTISLSNLTRINYKNKSHWARHYAAVN